MRVLHFAADWLPASEVFVHDTVTRLPAEAVVLCTGRPVNTDRFPVSSLTSLAGLERILRFPVVRAPTLRAAAAMFARRRRVQVVHAHHGYRVEIPLAAARRNGVPLVLGLHGHDLTGWLESRPGYYRKAAAFINAPANRGAVVVPSRFLGNIAECVGFAPERIVVAPSGVDTARFPPNPLPDGPPTALFVGRFVEKKGLDVLSTSWMTVQARIPHARLVVAGFGPLEGEARSITGNVQVVLAPDAQRVRDLMRSAWIVVSPSRTSQDDAVESLLMVNVEAQASGRAVVTTDHGGIPEYVEADRSAMVVPEGDAGALAGAMVTLLSDRGAASRLGANGPAVAAPLDLAVTTARLVRLYRLLDDDREGTARPCELGFDRGRADDALIVPRPMSPDSGRDRPELAGFLDDRAPELDARRTTRAGVPQAR